MEIQVGPVPLLPKVSVSLTQLDWRTSSSSGGGVQDWARATFSLAPKYLVLAEGKLCGGFKKLKVLDGGFGPWESSGGR